MRIETKYVQVWECEATSEQIHYALGRMPSGGKVRLEYSGLANRETAHTTLTVIVTEGDVKETVSVSRRDKPTLVEEDVLDD